MSETNKLPPFILGTGWKAVFLIGFASIAITTLVSPSLRMVFQANENRQAMDAAKGLLESQQDAWNQGNLDGFMLGYWNDNELTFYSDNTIEKGYGPLKERYFKRYKSEGKEMGKLTFSNVDVQPKSDSFAVVRGHWKVEKSKETAEGLFTLWVERKPEGWRIVHDHTSAAPKKE
jgi:beta-aspartyl-peptidase (threonine type)